MDQIGHANRIMYTASTNTLFLSAVCQPVSDRSSMFSSSDFPGLLRFEHMRCNTWAQASVHWPHRPPSSPSFIYTVAILGYCRPLLIVVDFTSPLHMCFDYHFLSHTFTHAQTHKHKVHGLLQVVVAAERFKRVGVLVFTRRTFSWSSSFDPLVIFIPCLPTSSSSALSLIYTYFLVVCLFFCGLVSPSFCVSAHVWLSHVIEGCRKSDGICPQNRGALFFFLNKRLSVISSLLTAAQEKDALANKTQKQSEKERERKTMSVTVCKIGDIGCQRPCKRTVDKKNKIWWEMAQCREVDAVLSVFTSERHRFVPFGCVFLGEHNSIPCCQ